MIDCIYLGERGRCKRRKGFHVLGGFCAICELRRPNAPGGLAEVLARRALARRDCPECQAAARRRAKAARKKSEKLSQNHLHRR